ncbi:TRAP transporter large permease subunit [Mycolicibacterium goodii]|uniref:TRAP transporter large permease subunit n=1 Tax=Mycolicibacterium goodii TaxID=134601 RepID=UPI000B28FCA1
MSIDPIAVGILIGGFAVLILLRIPIALALALAAVFEAFYLDLPLPIVGQRMVAGLDIFALLAIPFFILGARSWPPAGSPGD